MPEPIRIEFEVDGSDEVNTKVNSLLNRFDDLKKRTADVKKELAGVSGPEQAAAGIEKLAGDFIKTGAAALILQQAISALSNQYKEFLKDAEESPDLFTREQLANTEELSNSFSRLGDTFKKMRIEVLEPTTGVLSDIADWYSEAYDKAYDYKHALDEVDDSQKKAYLSALDMVGIRFYDDEDIQSAQEMLTLQERILDTVDLHNQMNRIGRENAMEAAREEAKEKDKKSKSTTGLSRVDTLLDVTEDIQRVSETFINKQDALKEKQDEVLDSIQEALKKGYGPWSKTVQGLRQDFDDLSEAMSDNISDQRQNTQEMILERTKQILSVGGLTDAEEKYLLQVGQQRGIYTEQAVIDSMRLIDESRALADGFKSEAERMKDEMGGVTEAMDTIDGKVIDVFFQAHWYGFGGPGQNMDIMSARNYGGANQRPGIFDPRELPNTGSYRSYNQNADIYDRDPVGIKVKQYRSGVDYLVQEVIRAIPGR